MFRELNTTPSVPSDGILRHADGSIDFDTYRERARRQRNAAVQSLMKEAGVLLSRITTKLAGKAERGTARHQPKPAS